jgi:hypothetical protein
MARDIHAYREVAVESFYDGARVRVRPLNGQAYHSGLRVDCPQAMRDPERHPVGTCFKVLAKLTDRLGGTPYLYIYHGDPIEVLTPQQCKTFLAAFRRGRI